MRPATGGTVRFRADRLETRPSARLPPPDTPDILALMTTRRLRRRFDRRAALFDDFAFVHRYAAAALFDRLEPINVEPGLLLDVGAGTGHVGRELQRRYRRARVVDVDLSPGMLHVGRRGLSLRRRPAAVCADARALPFGNDIADLIVSNLCLPWLGEPDAFIREAARVLKPGAPLLFSSLGPDSFRELREAVSAAGVDAPAVAFLDMHDVGDALVRGRLTAAVLDVERTSVRFGGANDLWRDLRGSASTAPARGLLTPRRLQRVADSLPRQVPGGEIEISLELVFGHAFAGFSQQNNDTIGEVRIEPGAIGRRSAK